MGMLVPILINFPVFIQKVLPHSKTLFFIINTRFYINVLVGMIKNLHSRLCRYCPISHGASEVLMLVYIDTASEVTKRRAESESVRFSRRYFSVKVSLK